MFVKKKTINIGNDDSIRSVISEITQENKDTLSNSENINDILYDSDKDESIISIFVPVEYQGNSESQLDEEDKTYYSTILKSQRVFVIPNLNMIDPIFWSCKIERIRIKQDKEAEYLLKYCDIEPGKRRESFWKCSWEVSHQNNYGRHEDDDGRIVTMRNSRQTRRYLMKVLIYWNIEMS